MGSVAQLVEQATFNREVPGSSPGGPTTRAFRARAFRAPPLLVGAGVAAAAVALLLIVAALSATRWPFGFDRSIILGMRAWSVRPGGGPPWLRDAARDVTSLGSGTVLTCVVVAVTGLLLIQRHRLTALALVAAAWSGSAAVSLLKAHVGRARPTIVDHWAVVDNSSFPSGHAASSAVIYLTLAAVASQVTHGRVVRGYLIGLAIVLVGAIGLSRVYLGVHWPSDVLAGWSFGTLWAIGWWHATAKARASLAGRSLNPQ